MIFSYTVVHIDFKTKDFHVADLESLIVEDSFEDMNDLKYFISKVLKDAVRDISNGEKFVDIKVLEHLKHLPKDFSIFERLIEVGVFDGRTMFLAYSMS